MNLDLLGKALRVLRNEGWGGVRHRIRHRLVARFPRLAARRWLQSTTPSASDLERMRSEVEDFVQKPRISVILPVYNPSEAFLRDALQSVLDQVYPEWELCVADDASTDKHVHSVLEEYSRRDARIKVVYRPENGHISAASNDALESATGEFVALLDHDDVLAPHALFEMVRYLNRHPLADVLYSDEDKITVRNERTEPTFKADWSPEYFLCFMYIGHLTLYRRSLVEQAGRFRIGFEGSQDYDLALRVTELTSEVHHVPGILYHWRMHRESVAQNIKAKPYAFLAAKRALSEALQRRGISEPQVEDAEAPGLYRLRFPVRRPPRAAVLHYQRADELGCESLAECAQAAAEIGVDVVVGAAPGGAKSLVSPPQHCRLVEDMEFPRAGAFYRYAAEQLDAEVLVLLGSRLCASSGSWLHCLLEYGLQEAIGVVGARLIGRSGRLLHAGYTVFGAKVSHNFFMCSGDEAGYAARLMTVHNVTAVSSLCLCVDKQLLLSSGACDEEYSSETAFDLDVCLAAWQRGQRVVWTPYAEMLRDADWPERVLDLQDLPHDLAVLEKKHSILSLSDRFYPHGLDRRTADFRMAV